MAKKELHVIPRDEILKIAGDIIKQKQDELASSPFYIDEKLALKAINFITLLKHTTGRYAGVKFQLLPFQIEFIIDVIATYRKDTKTRRYQTALLFLPRKNGKTELIAAILLFFLFIDAEQGKEIYCAANETEQAKIIFNATITMLKQNISLIKKSKIFKSTKTIEKNGEFLDFVKVLTANADTKDGLKPYVFVYDELHAAKDGELWRVLEEGQINRDSPLAFIISTAGYNLQGVMKQKYDYAKQAKAGIIEDDSFYSMIFEADPGKWQDENEWVKANPALGYGVKLENLRIRYKKALSSGEEEMAFKTKHLNIWCNSSTSWINDAVWQNNIHQGFNDSDFRGVNCYAGLDLSSTTDITAYVVICELGGFLHIFPHFWIPEDNARERSRRDRVPYIDWINKGLIKQTPGNVVDYDFVERDILQINEKFNIKETAYDRWNSTKIITNLTNEGLNLSPFGQGYASMSAPTKAIQTLALAGKINHFGNPILRWMISNVEIIRDSAENIKADKSKSRERIDGVVALVMAYAIKTINEAQKPNVSPYLKGEIKSF
ncbi:terminase TerL endonuclease subunit [Campylobacter sp. RM16190]|uniref:terminase large subunit n=1 Tax=Campylobacter sp. RM16190 TaxID=1705727 RepID=UPI00147675C1|nr:terminase TerL endonuclease subunit [Campylobacter sp. RM16190]